MQAKTTSPTFLSPPAVIDNHEKQLLQAMNSCPNTSPQNDETVVAITTALQKLYKATRFTTETIEPQSDFVLPSQQGIMKFHFMMLVCIH